MNRARFTAIAIIVATGLAIFCVAIIRICDARRPHVEVERDRFPVMGIDLSAHNGDVNFDKIVADGVDFVFLKASEGTTFRDPKFIHNYTEARKSGMKVGAYHFFRFDCDGYEQGRNFLSTIDSLNLDLPLAIDIEEHGNPLGFSTDKIVETLRGMIFALEGHRHKVILYTNKNGYNRFIRGRFDELPVWVCSFTDPPITSDNWKIWQHSHQSRIEGINGNVDLNTFNGDSISWVRWLADIKQ